VGESIILYGLLAPVGIKGFYGDAHSGWSDWADGLASKVYLKIKKNIKIVDPK
jgi:hypothetical protein